MRRRLVFCLLFLGVLFSGFSVCAQAQALDFYAFSKLPVMEGGRIKPMESFARAALERLSGQDTGAIAWLAEVLFNPSRAEERRVLKIRNPDVLNMLEIERRPGGLYTYAEITQVLRAKQDVLLSILEADEAGWSPAQRDLVILQRDTVFLGDLLSSLSLFLPLSVEVPAALPPNAPDALTPYAGQVLTYEDILKIRPALESYLGRLVTEKGEDPSAYTHGEQALAYLSFAAAHLREAGVRSTVFRVISVHSGDEWLSPWALTESGRGGPDTVPLFEGWAALAEAYRVGDAPGWRVAAQALYDGTTRLAGPGLRLRALDAERFYNAVRPFRVSTVLYGLTLLSLLFLHFRSSRGLQGAAVLFLCAGAAFHAAGIGVRIYILERPPVSTLYESVVFVGFVVVLYGLAAFWRAKTVFWLFFASISGIFLHVLAFSQDSGGDNLLMLTAVLNTNFWLATHVICITTGYAFCLVTSILAHYELFSTGAGRGFTFSRSLHAAALLALFFSAVGTLLGGIWADQSWGRFWGWDPKENGALLIVLWLVWMLHGRVSGQMSPVFVAAGLAYLSVIVALSWFGVNLLSVGLHAYGFTDSAAWGLGAFIAGESVLVAGLVRKNCLQALP